jgi:hypothetical protein
MELKEEIISKLVLYDKKIQATEKYIQDKQIGMVHRSHSFYTTSIYGILFRNVIISSSV